MKRVLLAFLITGLLITLTACPGNPPKQPPPTVIVHKP